MSAIVNKEDRDKIEQARILYLSGYTVSECATMTNMAVDTVRMLAFGVDGTARDRNCWKVIKDRVGDASIAVAVLEKKSMLDRTAGLALKALSKSLEVLNERIHKGDVELSPKDMGELAKIIFGMDKIVRLETGQATEIIKRVGLTAEEARKILADDPFNKSIVDMEVEYVEAKEIEPNKTLT